MKSVNSEFTTPYPCTKPPISSTILHYCQTSTSKTPSFLMLLLDSSIDDHDYSQYPNFLSIPSIPTPNLFPSHNNIHTSPHPISSRNFPVLRDSMIDGPVLEAMDAELLLATCITRTLPPALTLQHGLDEIKAAVEQLKSNPPFATSGMYRFQVAVPPGAKALNWFCCQPEASEVFPQFFLSKHNDDPTYKSLFLNRTFGIFGIGAALCVKGFFPCASAEEITFKRCHSVDSTLVVAYGFVVIFSIDVSWFFHTFLLIIFSFWQIELVEFEGISILAATLVWNDSSLCVFEEAVQTYELSLYQIRHHLWPITEECRNTCINSALRKFNMVEDKSARVVCVNALSEGGMDLWADIVELKDVSCSCQFSIRFSRTVAISNNMWLKPRSNPLAMVPLAFSVPERVAPQHYPDFLSEYQLENVDERSHSMRNYGNINTLWASLIVEECSRLGLTYFCVAPGSRSSPLAIAASSHPLTTCIVCYDERSLAFHAVGYARGSHKPAVVITSSGTAVSNLLPAVVEASQDFVPLVLLTADRPPELHDAGANQAINQVNHFGSFVRYFFNLPAPTDDIPARMVLTTIDCAIYWATSSPCGPVHINCSFRELLEDSPKMWTVNCLKGLEFWMSGAEPFTNYIQMQHSFACDESFGHMAEVLNVIQGAKRGLLLIGAIHSEDDTWAALLLAKHLQWPAVADILSGLRLRKHMTSFSDIEDNFLFVDHFDHCLLSNVVRNWAKADVIIQIGTRITSKRISQMLEDCSPCSYIVVDNHRSRHDPSHIVTHRIQSTITQFTDCVLKACIPQRSTKWNCFLHTLDKMVAWEIAFLVQSEYSLTEPYVAHVILESLSCGSAIFVGNSMPIRDADMYGCKWAKCTHGIAMLSSGLPCHWIQVAGNRGASGIDGLLSTAVGFAVGCNKRVLCIIGDVSFLHDTNGLALLKQRVARKQITILVINNHGGAIFSLLPIVARTEQNVLDQYFYTSHNVSIHNLCGAHGVKHVQVQTKMELQDALFTTQQGEVDCVIEVESRIDTNATFHSSLRKISCQAANHSLSVLSRLSCSDTASHDYMFHKIYKMEYSIYRVQLCAPPTSATNNYKLTTYYREGFVLTLSLEDGSVGFGEVAPLEIHKENFLQVEDQLRFLIHVMEGANISLFLPLLKGSFSSWILNSLGISPGSIFPSVRCGLEMAILNAIAAAKGSSLLNILHPQTDNEEEISGKSSNVKICALIDCNGTPAEVAYVATSLVKEGFTAIKLKVARRADPTEDASVIQELRKQVGEQIELRADANRNWTYEDAILFGTCVKDCGLQYIEEPVANEDDIIKFCEETGLPVALDETLNCIQENPHEMLARFTHPGIVAVVIKPSVVGGFENAALIARWAQQQGKLTVVSAAFESGLGLSVYIQFSRYLELQNADICRVMNKEPAFSVAHGLGTYRWFREDVTTEPLSIRRNPCSGFMEASVVDAGQLLLNFQVNQNSIIQNVTGGQVLNYQLTIDVKGFSISINVQETGADTNKNVIVFLHGFLGTGEDWIPIMKAVSGSARCIAIDLPGHGRSKVQNQNQVGNGPAEEPPLSIEVIAEILCKLFHFITPKKVTLVGYSMGARITLYMTLRCSDKVKGAVVISGSPGLKDEVSRKMRRVKDDSRACLLVAHGLEFFLNVWYAGELWNSLRAHPHFKQIVACRLKHDDVPALAKALSDLSIARQPALWEDLKHCSLPLLFVVGEKDEKFKTIAIQMSSEISQGTRNRDSPAKCTSEIVEIPNCGHAAHLENPLSVIGAIRKFLTKLNESVL
ncbi:hypothetical protein LguiA_032536 [Lonicera macranthoides]